MAVYLGALPELLCPLVEIFPFTELSYLVLTKSVFQNDFQNSSTGVMRSKITKDPLCLIRDLWLSASQQRKAECRMILKPHSNQYGFFSGLVWSWCVLVCFHVFAVPKQVAVVVWVQSVVKNS